MFAAVFSAEGSDPTALVEVGRAFSPRLEVLPREVVLDVGGLSRLFGDARTIGTEIRRSAADRGLRVRVAIAPMRVVARLLVRHRAGVTVVDSVDDEVFASDPGLPRNPPTFNARSPRSATTAAAVAEVPLELLPAVIDEPSGSADVDRERARESQERVRTLRRWGLRTLGDLAALPADDVAARLGQDGVRWWHLAQGQDRAPLVPAVPEERFEQSLDLEWPIEGLEPLSFVLGRLLEPLSAQLDRKDRGVAVLTVRLHLVNKTMHEQSLQLPTPMRDPKALRTVALLALEGNPPPAGIDRVTVVADPTPARVIQHSLLTRPVPLPDEVATLMARLNAVMGEGRCGAPMVVDTWRPGAFAVTPFTPDTSATASLSVPSRGAGRSHAGTAATSTPRAEAPSLALRRFRFPVPARVAVEHGKPVRVATDRRGLTGGRVEVSAGPWRTSGQWWEDVAPTQRAIAAWDRDEWDVTLADGATYRLFAERGTKAWFIDGLFD
jgi:protein ImuB